MHENTVGLVQSLAEEHMLLAAGLVTAYAMVLPAVKVVLLFLSMALRHGDSRRVRWARWCAIAVRALSKWASPDMFAYILMMYLFRSINKPPQLPQLSSDLRLGLGFTCFCVF